MSRRRSEQSLARHYQILGMRLVDVLFVASFQTRTGSFVQLQDVTDCEAGALPVADAGGHFHAVQESKIKKAKRYLEGKRKEWVNREGSLVNKRTNKQKQKANRTQLFLIR